MSIIYFGVGSNLGKKSENIQTALKLMSDEFTITGVSSFYYSKPQGFNSDNDFINIAVVGSTKRTPLEVLKIVKTIETEMGRTEKKGDEYEDRIIDIDILLIDDVIYETSELTIPHPNLHDRVFVLKPLLEIGDPIHPLFEKPISELFAKLITNAQNVSE